MPFDPNIDLDEVEQREGGKGLRRILEDAIAETREVRKENVRLRSRDVIQEQGLSLVKPEDLEGVSSDELVERAQAVQEERLSAQKDLARDVFARKGLEGEELDKAVEEFIAAPEGADDAYQRVRSVASAGGTVVPVVDSTKLHGIDAIKAGLKA